MNGAAAADAPAAILGDPRFFACAGPFTLEALAEAAGATAERADVLGGRKLAGVAALQTATPGQVAVLHNPRYAAAAEQTLAGAVVVSPALAPRIPAASALIVTPDPHFTWAHISALFHPAPRPTPGIHPTAVIDPSAEIGAGCEIGPYAVIGARVSVGDGCKIGPHAVIEAGVQMGPGCRIGAGASLTHALLGARVYIYPGARIGQEGFGFAITPQGFVTVPQLGRVILHDDVEVGANTTIDRGASHDTVIGVGSRLDNLVQIGHNSQLGRYCVMAGQSGMAGSCTLEDFVQIGAQAGLGGHLRIGTKARVGPQGGVMSDVPAGSDVIGSPAMPVREFFRNVAVLRRLAKRGNSSAAGHATPGADGHKAAS